MIWSGSCGLVSLRMVMNPMLDVDPVTENETSMAEKLLDINRGSYNNISVTKHKKMNNKIHMLQCCSGQDSTWLNVS